MPSSVVMVAASIFAAMKRLFKLDKVTGMASVELWVMMTTLLLVTRFLIESAGARVYSSRFMTATSQVIALLNYSMVHYTLGLMQLSAARVNDYFQVWAVLLVTLQYSVQVGLPYSRSKQQIPLLDLMSSFWAANLLRVQTTMLLRVPLWLIWALNAARIISFFSSSDKAEASNQENTRLVSDYMRYEHTLSANTDTATMTGYNYLVHGEYLVAMEILQQKRRAGSARYRLQLNPQHEKLITIEKIWNVDAGKSGLLGRAADHDNRLKDVCLSFALHKLLRRRFYNLPIYEAMGPVQEKTRRLVFQYILQDRNNYERAFRITEVELSFLRDSFYSRHAATFADGFPFLRMLLSLLLIVAIGYIAYPVRYIPQRIDQADKNQITHGVFVTRFIIGLIVCKELWEIYIYTFAPWTKVQMICMYIKHQCLRRPLVEKAMRLVFCLISQGKWNHQIGQYNLLISCHKRMVRTTRIKLKAEVQKAIFDSFGTLRQDQQRLVSYFSSTFESNELLCSKLARINELEADSHRILVWHIATCLCEINLSGQAKRRRLIWLGSRPLIKEKRIRKEVREHYITAVSISNYCAYLLTKALVPDNGLVANRVFDEVRREAQLAIFRVGRPKTLQHIYDRLKNIVKNTMQDNEDVADEESQKEEEQGDGAAEIAAEEQMIEEVNGELEEGNFNNDDFQVVDEPHNEEPKEEPKGDDNGFDNTIIKMGSELGLQLIETYTDRDQADLWRDMAKFWAGFLLHLAASTGAAKHKTHLNSNGELITHLWALLTHAGYLGGVNHGHQLLDQDDLDDVNPLS